MEAGFIYLLLSIVSTTCLNLSLRAFKKYEVNTFQAIVINYFVCSFFGSLALGRLPVQIGFWNENWFPYAIIMAIVFIVGFNIVAKTIQIFGVTIGSVVQKMSLIASVSFGILYFNESINAIKIIGVGVALLAVVLTNYPSNKEDTVSSPELIRKFFYFLILTFLVDATISIALQYIELRVSPQGNDPSFIIFLFLIAGIIGAIYWGYNLLQGKMKPKKRDFLGGLILGIPNFGSLYFMMLALGQPGWEGSVIYPVMNVAIISLSAIMAFILFKEKLSKINVLGVFSAIIAILFIGFSNEIINLLQ